jgi:ATP-binding cassette subfamily F protein 3
MQDFEGGMVFVSHDRHLLRTCADELLLVADGKLTEFDGDLDDYAAWLATQRNAEKAPEPDVAAEKSERIQQRSDAKANRQAILTQRRPLIKEIEQLEKKLAKWNEEKAALDAQFADPEFYATVDRQKSEEMHKQAGLLGDQIDDAEMRWLEVHEALEALPAVD